MEGMEEREKQRERERERGMPSFHRFSAAIRRATQRHHRWASIALTYPNLVELHSASGTHALALYTHTHTRARARTTLLNGHTGV